MNTKEQLLSVYVQEAFSGNQDLILSKSNIIFDTVELYYLDNCGMEHRIDENPIFIKMNEDYKISFKGQKRNLSYLVKYFHLIKTTSIELSKDEINSYTNKDGSMSIPQSNFTPYGINFWNFTPKPYIKKF
ncbi:hypothetical protein [uncultured Eubacterium sp.]|uniref:hypothetical protein n=1 Tax=uncultured Eubacterium sp. TaxID=165185 RepID=UPI002594B776|nr:hypothetical protein [uncultured Eubacterium sp.]